MKPLTFAELLHAHKQTEKRIRKNKESVKALKKAKRKLKHAIKADSIHAMKIAIGMAQIALSKAEFSACTLFQTVNGK